MKKKPITKKEAERIKKEMRKLLETAITAAERDDIFTAVRRGLKICHLLAELKKGLHPK